MSQTTKANDNAPSHQREEDAAQELERREMLDDQQQKNDAGQPAKDEGPSQRKYTPEKASEEAVFDTEKGVLSLKKKLDFGEKGIPLEEFGNIYSAMRSKLNEPQSKIQKVGRNAPCPCGSGKKFKKCCG